MPTSVPIKEISNGKKQRPPVPAQGNVKIIPDPTAQGHVPVVPERRYIRLQVRPVEIFRYPEAQKPGAADGDVRIAGEIKIDFYGEGIDSHP